ncbi:hypothetical protein KC367_g3 [Hortaea werneckii]|nr:hypothetical protein KC367_g3 [Hortaea werneckii]
MAAPRKPSRAIFPVSSSSQSLATTIELMTVSAPFWKKTISSFPSLVLVQSAYLQKRAMIPIRLDSEVKGKMFRISTLTTTCPVDVDVNVIDLRSRCDTCRPTAAVHCTIAISSGELAWYEVLTSPVSGSSSMVGVTLWHTPSASTISLTLVAISLLVLVPPAPPHHTRPSQHDISSSPSHSASTSQSYHLVDTQSAPTPQESYSS